MPDELAPEEVQEAADRTVEEWLRQAGVTGPPVDATALARRLGLPVGQGPARGRRVAAWEEPTAEALQWAAAQAVGARLRTDLLRRLGLGPEQARALGGASLVNLLAARLLLPSAWFGGDARELGYDVEELKRRYATAGYERVAWRLLDLPEPCVLTVVDNDHVTGRRSNAWRVRRELAPAERQCQRYVNHYSRPHAARAGGWSVQGWPVHRPDWKREILRSVLDEDAEG